MPIINMVYKKKKWWKPWSNTIAYYKFDWNTNDYSWNWYNFTTIQWTAEYNTVNTNKQAAHFLWTWIRASNWFAYRSNSWSPSSWNMTISFWYKCLGSTWTTQEILCNRDFHWYTWMCMLWPDKEYRFHGSAQERTWHILTEWTWTQIVNVVNWGNCYVYINWNLVYSDSYSYGSGSQSLCIWWVVRDVGTVEEPARWDLSEVIIESTPRTAQEVADYYNSTKSNYWL